MIHVYKKLQFSRKNHLENNKMIENNFNETFKMEYLKTKKNTKYLNNFFSILSD